MKTSFWVKVLLAGSFCWLRWLALACVLVGATSSALAAKIYSDNGDGMVTDPTTGLVWMRCSMGQTWDGTTCTGTASGYTWDQAVALTSTVTFAGHGDWRVPSIRELLTIVDRSIYGPAIDAVAFPNTPASTVFWSASAVASYSYNARYVYFGDGGTNGYSKSSASQVRLVRAGQSLGLLDIARPDTDYVDQGNGTVAHTPTRLMWQRCAVGQTWTGTTCSGTASTFTWEAAKLLTSTFAGQTDWRLPTEEELLSMVDYSRYSPALNTTLFPNTSASSFWSASALAGASGDAWYVNFDGGYDDSYYYGKSHTYRVRLVRAGQSFGPLTLSVSKTGTGQLNSSGIECSTVCNSGYYPGDVVILTATPAVNLISWGGACASAGAAASCTITMDAAKSVTASFLDTPLISGLPTALTFATQNIGSTSAAQSATLTNTGTAALTISSIAASGDYAVSHNCGIGLSVGSFCTLNITFTPTASSTRSGSITINSNAPGGSQSIALTGTGQGSTSVVSPASLSFAAQGVGTTSAAKTVTLSNTGGLVLNIASIVASGDFAISSSTCGATLAQAASCSIGVTFMPTAVGARSGSLVITSDATSSPNTISLSGTGIAVALVSLSPASLNFVSQGVGTSSAAQTVTLTNSGGASLNLTSITASGDFAVTNNCGGGLAAGGSCKLTVTFTPAIVGNRTGAISITDNASGSPQTVVVSGTGVASNVPLCTLTATPVSIRKGGSSTLTASCNPAATSYTWTGGSCAGNISATCTVSPAATTIYSVTGSNSNGTGSATTKVTIRAIDLTPILMLLLD